MECIIEQMQDDPTGVPVRTVKSFMSKIPSVFTGEYRIQNHQNFIYLTYINNIPYIMQYKHDY